MKTNEKKYELYTAAQVYRHFRHRNPSEFLKLRELLAKASSTADEIRLFCPFYSEKVSQVPAELWLYWKKTFADFQKPENSRHIVVLGDENYPESFLELAAPPFVLYVLGSSKLSSFYGISVVGSREPISETQAWIEKELTPFIRTQNQRSLVLGEQLSLTELSFQSQSENRRFCVISGAARGVDQLAHSISLRHQVPTLAFLPSGFMQIYPAHFKDWISGIIEGGGSLISEYDPHFEMHRKNFDERNRLIAAMGLASLIVQASKKSGTLLTARHAAELGRLVMVVPSHPSCLKSLGGLELICEGAVLVKDHHDIHSFFESEATHGSLMTHRSSYFMTPHVSSFYEKHTVPLI